MGEAGISETYLVIGSLAPNHLSFAYTYFLILLLNEIIIESVELELNR